MIRTPIASAVHYVITDLYHVQIRRGHAWIVYAVNARSRTVTARCVMFVKVAPWRTVLTVRVHVPPIVQTPAVPEFFAPGDAANALNVVIAVAARKKDATE